MIGAVRGIDPDTGLHFDDTRRYIEAAALTRRATATGSTRATRCASTRGSTPRSQTPREVTDEHDHERPRDRPPQRSPAPTPRPVEALGRFGVATVHEAMGRVGLMQTVHAADLHRRPALRHRRSPCCCSPATTGCCTWRRSRLQTGDVVVAACTTESDDGFFGDLLATCFRARGATGPRHRRRRARRQADLDRDGLPGVLPGDQRQGHGQGHARLGQRSGGLRQRAGQPRRRRVADDDGVVVVPAASAQRGRPTPPRRARPTRRTSGRGSRPASWGSTCTRCASRWPRPACSYED